MFIRVLRELQEGGTHGIRLAPLDQFPTNTFGSLSLLNSDRVIEWVSVPSHGSIGGDVQADTLATHGRLGNSLYPSEGAPNGGAARVFTTPKIHPRPLRSGLVVIPP